jgi:coproporphyrinogen III oxidase-like Fe-S oxidoreductase
VDLYQLNIYKGGRLEQAVKKGKIAKPADIPMQADMFAKGVGIMEKARYIRISQSHWAKTTRERNIYNSLVRTDSVCIPFGSGAAGWLSDYFFYQDNKLVSYYKRIDRAEKPILMVMKRHPYFNLFKNIEEGLERNACNFSLLSQRYNLDLNLIFSPLFNQWEKVGLIKIKDGLCELTLAGEFWYVNLCQLMIDYFQEVHEHKNTHNPRLK